MDSFLLLFLWGPGDLIAPGSLRFNTTSEPHTLALIGNFPMLTIDEIGFPPPNVLKEVCLVIILAFMCLIALISGM